MPRKSKQLRLQYDPKALENAVAAVKANVMSIRKAAKHYDVPRSTIGDRISGRVKEGTSPGKKPVYPIEVENQVAEKIKQAARMGFGITRAQLCFKMARLAATMNYKTPFHNGVPGKDWIAGFQKRHPDISLRSPTPLNNVRARMLNTEVTARYFDDLNKTLTSLGLHEKPHLIWNIDETNVSLTHKPSRILAEVGQRNVPGRVGNCRDGVTVLACINAAGDDIPPLVIVKGLTEKAVRAYNVVEGPVGTKYTYQKKAWMEDILGVSWFKDHFLAHCGRERPQIIILDSHSSHETVGLIEVARENGITLFALPPHTTQYLNPLDKTVFGPFQREYNRQCSDFMSVAPNHLVTKWEWPRLFKQTYTKTVISTNIKKGFEVCGIYPFDPTKIKDSAFAPSVPFVKPVTSPVNSPETVSPANEAPQQMDENSVGNNIATSAVTNDAVVIATADETGTANIVNLDDAEVLLDLITSGKLNILQCDENETDSIRAKSETALESCHSSSGTLQEVGPSIPSNIFDNSWSEGINNVFDLPVSSAKQSNTKLNKKKLTSHRLLTSDEVYTRKKLEIEEKEKIAKEKEERKLKRQQKMEQKKNEPKNKRQKKKQ